MLTALFFKEIRTRNISSFFTWPSLTTWKKGFQMALESNRLKTHCQHKQTKVNVRDHMSYVTSWCHIQIVWMVHLCTNFLPWAYCVWTLNIQEKKPFCSYCWLARRIKTTCSNSCKSNRAVGFVVVLLLSNGRHQTDWN